jgi:hypothetical protein
MIEWGELVFAIILITISSVYFLSRFIIYRTIGMRIIKESSVTLEQGVTYSFIYKHYPWAKHVLTIRTHVGAITTVHETTYYNGRQDLVVKVDASGDYADFFLSNVIMYSKVSENNKSEETQ